MGQTKQNERYDVRLIYVEQEPEVYSNHKSFCMHSTLTPTNVHDVAFAIDHYVTIVPVFDLQYVTRDGICRHRLDEIQTSVLKFDSIWTTVLCNKEFREIVDFCASHLVSRSRIRNHVDDPALSVRISERTDKSDEHVPLDPWQ
jgi:hypothetical protein